MFGTDERWVLRLMVRTVVLVSGGGTNLQSIIAARLFEEIQNCEIVSVISSDPDAYALDRARAAGIDISVVDAKTFPTKRTFNTALLQKLQDLDTQLVVLSGFMHILQRPIIKEYENRIMNVHPALLPSFSGTGLVDLALHQRVLDSGAKITGATVHFVTEDLDKGPIILQKAVDVLEGDNPKILQRRVQEQAEWELLPRAMDLFCRNKLEVSGNRVIIKE